MALPLFDRAILLGLLAAGGLVYLVQRLRRPRPVCPRCGVRLQRWHTGLIYVMNEAGVETQVRAILQVAAGVAPDPLIAAISREDALGPPPALAWIAVMIAYCPTCYAGELTIERHTQLHPASNGDPGPVIGRAPVASQLVQATQARFAEWAEEDEASDPEDS